MMTTPLILASTSRYRRELLSRLGLPFEVRAPGVDETPGPRESAASLAARLARDKALAVAAAHPAAVVLGSDQVASLGGRLLGKPGTEAAAVEQLLAASGREVEFFTAVCVARDGGQSCFEAIDRTRVRFRPLDLPRSRAYVQRERPLDCAGGFKCEGLGIALFERIESQDPTALVGLPLIQVCTLLERAGIDVLGACPP